MSLQVHSHRQRPGFPHTQLGLKAGLLNLNLNRAHQSHAHGLCKVVENWALLPTCPDRRFLLEPPQPCTHLALECTSFAGLSLGFGLKGAGRHMGLGEPHATQRVRCAEREKLSLP